VEKCCRDVLSGRFVGKCCREVLWGSGVKKSCEGVLWLNRAMGGVFLGC